MAFLLLSSLMQIPVFGFTDYRIIFQSLVHIDASWSLLQGQLEKLSWKSLKASGKRKNPCPEDREGD